MAWIEGKTAGEKESAIFNLRDEWTSCLDKRRRQQSTAFILHHPRRSTDFILHHPRRSTAFILHHPRCSTDFFPPPPTQNAFYSPPTAAKELGRWALASLPTFSWSVELRRWLYCWLFRGPWSSARRHLFRLSPGEKSATRTTATRTRVTR